MKIILTEKQLEYLKENDLEFNRTKKLINNLFDEGYGFEDIVKYTGLSIDVVVLCLKDREIFNENDCNKKYDILYRYLYLTDFIDHQRSFNDGSKVTLDYNFFSGSISFIYNYGNFKISGYATLMWNNDCFLPFDVQDYYYEDRYQFNVGYSENKELSDELKNIKTMNDLIEYFNNDYFVLLKGMLDRALDDIFENLS
jgi:hypothetical protein